MNKKNVICLTIFGVLFFLMTGCNKEINSSKDLVVFNESIGISKQYINKIYCGEDKENEEYDFIPEVIFTY